MLLLQHPLVVMSGDSWGASGCVARCMACISMLARQGASRSKHDVTKCFWRSKYTQAGRAWPALQGSSCLHPYAVVDGVSHTVRTRPYVALLSLLLSCEDSDSQPPRAPASVVTDSGMWACDARAAASAGCEHDAQQTLCVLRSVQAGVLASGPCAAASVPSPRAVVTCAFGAGSRLAWPAPGCNCWY